MVRNIFFYLTFYLFTIVFVRAQIVIKPADVSALYSIHYLNAFWKLYPGSEQISGRISYYMICKSAGNYVVLDCDSLLIIDSVSCRNRLNFLHQNTQLKIYLEQPYLVGQTDSLCIYYHGIPKNTGFGSFKTDTHTNYPVVWTLSEPYGAKDWFPAPGTLDAKIDSLDITLETSVGNRAIANGILIKHELLNVNTQRFYYKHRYPIAPYLIAIAATNYTLTTDTLMLNNKKMPLVCYAYPEDSAGVWQAVLSNNQTLINFNEKFSEYPFINEQYGHAQINFSGGMEHQTLAFEGYFGEDLLAHELAHQWFGDKVTCQSWRDIWLHESFATYSEGLNYEWKKNLKEFENLRRKWNKQTINQPGGSVYVTEDTSDFKTVFDYRLRYIKGAMVVNMLRNWVGDSVFFKAIQNYLNDAALVYKYASTHHLQNHFETVSGKNLNQFFNSWIYQEGYPRYTLFWQQEKDEIQLRLEQASSVNQSILYTNVLELGVVTDKNDTIIKKININKFNTDTVIKINTTVKEIIIDPYFQSLSGFNKVNPVAFKFNDAALHTYPNPAKKEWIIEYNTTSDAITDITWFNLLGQEIYHLSNNQYSFGTYNVISLNKIKPDTYVVRINTKLSLFTQFLVVLE